MHICKQIPFKTNCHQARQILVSVPLAGYRSIFASSNISTYDWLMPRSSARHTPMLGGALTMRLNALHCKAPDARKLWGKVVIIHPPIHNPKTGRIIFGVVWQYPHACEQIAKKKERKHLNSEKFCHKNWPAFTPPATARSKRRSGSVFWRIWEVGIEKGDIKERWLQSIAEFKQGAKIAEPHTDMHGFRQAFITCVNSQPIFIYHRDAFAAGCMTLH